MLAAGATQSPSNFWSSSIPLSQEEELSFAGTIVVSSSSDDGESWAILHECRRECTKGLDVGAVGKTVAVEDWRNIGYVFLSPESLISVLRSSLVSRLIVTPLSPQQVTRSRSSSRVAMRVGDVLLCRPVKASLPWEHILTFCLRVCCEYDLHNPES